MRLYRKGPSWIGLGGIHNTWTTLSHVCVNAMRMHSEKVTAYNQESRLLTDFPAFAMAGEIHLYLIHQICAVLL